MAVLLRADGTRETLDTAGGGLTLRQMQTIVGGDIEMVTLGGTPRRREVLVVNEDGLRLRLPVNGEASVLLRLSGRYGPVVGDAIMAVVIDSGTDAERWI